MPSPYPIPELKQFGYLQHLGFGSTPNLYKNGCGGHDASDSSSPTHSSASAQGAASGSVSTSASNSGSSATPVEIKTDSSAASGSGIATFLRTSPAWQSCKLFRSLCRKHDKPRLPSAETDFELATLGKIGSTLANVFAEPIRRLSHSATLVGEAGAGGERASVQDDEDDDTDYDDVDVEKHLNSNRAPSEVKKRSRSTLSLGAECDDLRRDSSNNNTNSNNNNNNNKKRKKGDTRRLALLLCLASLGGLLFGYDTGYISGVMAMDYVQNLQLSFEQRNHNWREVTHIQRVRFPNGTSIYSRNASWTAPSGQTGADLMLLGPITVSGLFEALNYSHEFFDLHNLSHDDKETIEAAFGWNESHQPGWLLLDEDTRPFWICNISRHHTHRLDGDHDADGKEKNGVDQKHAQFRNRSVVDQWYDNAGLNFESSSSPFPKTVMAEPPVRRLHRTARHVELMSEGEDGVAADSKVTRRADISGQVEALNHWPKWYHVQVKEKLLVVGMLSIGTAFGSLVGSDLADYLGRRVTLIIGTALFLVGVTDELASKHLESLTRGRFETGIAVGVITGVIVVYLTEIAPAHARGYVTCVFQFSVTVGLLFSSCMTMATRKFWGPESYRVPIGLQFLWGTGLLAGLLSLPESPRWYVKVGRVRRAKLALMSLIGVPIPAKGEEWPKDPRVEEEMEDILFNRNARLAAEAHVTADEADEDLTVSRYYLSWKKCFQGPWSQPSCSAKRTLFGAALMMFQQVTGINFIFYFGATFFKQQGFSNSFVVIVGLTTVNVVSTTVSLIMVPTVRRRPLLMSGAAAMALCQLTVGLIYGSWSIINSKSTRDLAGTAQHPQHAPEWLTFTTMIGVSIYIFSYAATWGPGAWTLLGEIFPMETRSRSIGIATATNWIFNSIACFITPLMVERDHGGLGMWVFLIWCGTSIGALAFVYLFVPETYGRTLEEIAFNFEFGPRKTRTLNLGLVDEESRAWLESYHSSNDRARSRQPSAVILEVARQTQKISAKDATSTTVREDPAGPAGLCSYKTTHTDSQSSQSTGVTEAKPASPRELTRSNQSPSYPPRQRLMSVASFSPTTEPPPAYDAPEVLSMDGRGVMFRQQELFRVTSGTRASRRAADDELDNISPCGTPYNKSVTRE